MLLTIKEGMRGGKESDWGNERFLVAECPLTLNDLSRISHMAPYTCAATGHDQAIERRIVR